MIEKLKNKINDIDLKRAVTEKGQKNLIESSTKFNEKIRNYIEYDVIEKDTYKEGVLKIQAVNQRIQECNSGIMKIKEKLKLIHNKLENNSNNNIKSDVK